jgi:ribosomal protein S18 acetylase RimI-like enzyme
MEIIIREAIPADSSLIAELSVKTFYETYAAHNSIEDMAKYTSSHFGEDRIRKEIEEKNPIYFLCHFNGSPAGYAAIRYENQPVELSGFRAAEIGRIYVLSEFKNKGIGKKLIRQCVEAAVCQGFERLWLGVWQENQTAIKFYEKNGFSRIGIQTFLLGDDLQQDWIMCRILK